jgi:hypothetical protein
MVMRDAKPGDDVVFKHCKNEHSSDRGGREREERGGREERERERIERERRERVSHFSHIFGYRVSPCVLCYFFYR